MIKREISEIKSLFELENCGIAKLCGCYVNGDKKKVTLIDELFLNIPQDEKHKYFSIFRKTLSGTIGKNLLDMEFTLDAYGDGEARDMLIGLRDSELKDEKLLEEFYDRIIANYDYPGNYLILLINQSYDVPGRTSDGIRMEDASDEVYRYILCSICHVTLSKAGLSYMEELNEFHDTKQLLMVDAPDIGFLFPAFNDRSADEESVLYYTKDPDEFQRGILDSVLSAKTPMPAINQKESFNNLVVETVGEDIGLETVKSIHENLNSMLEEAKETYQPAVLTKESARELLEKSGVEDDKLERFESNFDRIAGNDGELLVSNVYSPRKFEVKTPDVVVKINPAKMDVVKTMMIGDKQCLVIEINEQLEVNGISVNPDTGEVIER